MTNFTECVVIPTVTSIITAVVFSLLWPCVDCRLTLTPQEREAIRRAIDGWRANDAAEKWSGPLRGLLERTGGEK